jgi:hypothetical protein
MITVLQNFILKRTNRMMVKGQKLDDNVLNDKELQAAVNKGLVDVAKPKPKKTTKKKK